MSQRGSSWSTCTGHFSAKGKDDRAIRAGGADDPGSSGERWGTTVAQEAGTRVGELL